MNRATTFIEIGVSKGGFLQLWKRYLGPFAQIIGIDIDSTCKAVEEDQIAVRIGDQGDPAFLQKIIDEFGSPDVVLDDGSHMMSHISNSFKFLYPRMNKNGVYIVGAIGPDERILSATGRHDKIFVNDISFYFLAQRLPGTRWHHYDPGVQSSAFVQHAMIADLVRFHVRYVVRDRTWDAMNEPNQSAKSSGVLILDAFLAQHFDVVAQFSSLEILRRRP